MTHNESLVVVGPGIVVWKSKESHQQVVMTCWVRVSEGLVSWVEGKRNHPMTQGEVLGW